MPARDETGRPSGPPVLRLRYGPGGRSLEDLRADTATVSDIVLKSPPGDFRVAHTAVHLGAAVLIEVRASALLYVRSALHLARSALDHYQLVLELDSTTTIERPEGQVVAEPGDLTLYDMAQPTRSLRAPTGGRGQAHSLVLVLPRPLLAPLLAHPDGLHGAVVRGETPYGRVLGDYLKSLWRQARRLGKEEGEAAVQATLHLVAGAFGRAPAIAPAARPTAPGASLAAIERYIERNVTSPELTVDHLCRRFAISRAGLYRLFAGNGGLAQHIQRRRLQWAFAALVSPSQRHERILDIALACRFSSDATFIRAFRRQFGITPGELREVVARGGWDGDPDDALAAIGGPVAGGAWFRHLGREKREIDDGQTASRRSARSAPRR